MIVFLIFSLIGIMLSIVLCSKAIFTFSLIGIIVTVSYVFAILYIQNLKRNSELEKNKEDLK